MEAPSEGGSIRERGLARQAYSLALSAVPCCGELNLGEEVKEGIDALPQLCLDLLARALEQV